MAAAAHGDFADFDLVERFRGPIRALVGRYGWWTSRNPWMAVEDWEADAWEGLVRAWAAYPELPRRDRENVCIRSVHNVLINLVKRVSRLTRERAPGDGVLNRIEDATDRVSVLELALALEQIAGRARPDVRRVIHVLRRAPVCPTSRELARALECCPDTARSRLARVRRLLLASLSRG